MIEEQFLGAQDTKNALAKRLVANLRQQLDALERVLFDGEDMDQQEATTLAYRQRSDEDRGMRTRCIDGVFNGEQMVGEDGEIYSVPPNYASKSKLVEGDLLRLIFAEGGRFIFKQKGPIERDRTVGMLVKDEQSDRWCVVAEGRKFCVLSAAISFHHGQSGDDVVVLVPKNAPSRWAAVENIIKREASVFG